MNRILLNGQYLITLRNYTPYNISQANAGVFNLQIESSRESLLSYIDVTEGTYFIEVKDVLITLHNTIKFDYVRVGDFQNFRWQKYNITKAFPLTPDIPSRFENTIALPYEGIFTTKAIGGGAATIVQSTLDRYVIVADWLNSVKGFRFNITIEGVGGNSLSQSNSLLTIINSGGQPALIKVYPTGAWVLHVGANYDLDVYNEITLRLNLYK